MLSHYQAQSCIIGIEASLAELIEALLAASVVSLVQMIDKSIALIAFDVQDRPNSRISGPFF